AIESRRGRFAGAMASSWRMPNHASPRPRSVPAPVAYEAAPTPTERGAHCKLALALERPHQQEIRHVPARDEQAKDRRASQGDDGGSDLCDQILVQRL